jgi:hypothetical protein
MGSWFFFTGLLATGRPDRSAHPDARNAPRRSAQRVLALTRHTHPYTLVDMQPNSLRSAPPSAVSWALQRPKRIGRKWQCANAPTSATGLTSGGRLPRALSGCPHSRTRPLLLARALLLLVCALVLVYAMLCPYSSAYSSLMNHLQHGGLATTYI